MRISLCLTVINREDYQEILQEMMYDVFARAAEAYESKSKIYFDFEEETDAAAGMPEKIAADMNKNDFLCVKRNSVRPDAKENVQTSTISSDVSEVESEPGKSMAMPVCGNSAPKSRPVVSDLLVLSDNANSPYKLIKKKHESDQLLPEKLLCDSRLSGTVIADLISRLQKTAKRRKYRYRTISELQKENLCLLPMRPQGSAERRCGVMFDGVFRPESTFGCCRI